jgi:CheY-like chemotaxis protein
MADQKTVLIADDQQILRTLLRATLRKSSARVVEATDGLEALALARQERPDAVLLDVGMPGLDGYAVCRALKDDPATAGIIVVMLTARAQQAERERGLAAGADAYLTKPFRPAELLTFMNELLGR